VAPQRKSCKLDGFAQKRADLPSLCTRGENPPRPYLKIFEISRILQEGLHSLGDTDRDSFEQLLEDTHAGRPLRGQPGTFHPRCTPRWHFLASQPWKIRYPVFLNRRSPAGRVARREKKRLATEFRRATRNISSFTGLKR